MAFNMDKLAEIAMPRGAEATKRAQVRKENREWLRISQEIALCLHYYLRDMCMTQKELANKMGVSAVYVGKLLKGGENLTLETICKIQKVIGKDLISVTKPYVAMMKVSISSLSQFPVKAIASEKFCEEPVTKNDYVSVAEEAA